MARGVHLSHPGFGQRSSRQRRHDSEVEGASSSFTLRGTVAICLDFRGTVPSALQNAHVFVILILVKNSLVSQVQFVRLVWQIQSVGLVWCIGCSWYCFVVERREAVLSLVPLVAYDGALHRRKNSSGRTNFMRRGLRMMPNISNFWCYLWWIFNFMADLMPYRSRGLF